MNEKFKDYLLLNGSAFLTARNYISRIERVLSKVKEENFSEETLTNFLRELQKENSISTFNGYLNALTAYLKFIKKEIPLPKYLKDIKTLPKSIDENQLEKFIDILGQVLHTDFLKMKAVFYLFFYSGIRVSEINILKRFDFDFNKLEVKILVSKTREERIAVFNIKTKNAIQDYFNSEEEQDNAFNINSNAIQQRLKGFKQYLPELDIHAHIFRHSFARYCLEVLGLDILTVSKLMGHSNIATTERYLRLTNTQFRDIYHKKADNKGETK
jgi:integrase/recombinase XerD